MSAENAMTTSVDTVVMRRIGVGGFSFWRRPGPQREAAAEAIAEQFGGRVIYEPHQSGCDSYSYATWIEVPESLADEADAEYERLLAARTSA